MDEEDDIFHIIIKKPEWKDVEEIIFDTDKEEGQIKDKWVKVE